MTGQTDRLEGISNKLDGALTTLDAKAAEVDTLKAENAALKGQLESAPKPEQVATLTSERDAEKLRADTAAQALKDEQAALPGRINAEVTRLVAAQGGPALKIGAEVDNAPGAKADDKSPEAIRERAVAATNAQVTSFLNLSNSRN